MKMVDEDDDSISSSSISCVSSGTGISISDHSAFGRQHAPPIRIADGMA